MNTCLQPGSGTLECESEYFVGRGSVQIQGRRLKRATATTRSFINTDRVCARSEYAIPTLPDMLTSFEVLHNSYSIRALIRDPRFQVTSPSSVLLFSLFMIANECPHSISMTATRVVVMRM